MKKQGIEKVEEKAGEILGELVEQYEHGVLGVQRDYIARRAVVESDQDISILERRAYRKKVDAMLKKELWELRKAIDDMLTTTKHLITQLEDEKVVSKLVMDLRKLERADVKRAELDIERLKMTGGGKNGQ